MKLNHPKGLYFLFTIEMWERFSYYGMRALLMLYMTKFLLFSTEKSGNIYGFYTGLVYATPLIGGYLADRYLGQRKCILIGSILMVLGEFALSIPVIPVFYMALGLLIIGNGFFKPNISSIVGQLYKKNDPRKDGGFTIFYMGINVGAFLSPIICGTIGEKFSYNYGFIAAGIGMTFGLMLFLWGHKKFLANHGLEPVHCREKSTEYCKSEDSNNAINVDKPLSKEEWHRIIVIFVLVFFAIFFWSAFEQAGSSLTLFADESVNRTIPFLNIQIPASYFQAVNPMFIFILAPLFSKLWTNLSNQNKSPSIPAKFSMGLGFVAISFLFMVIASNMNQNGLKVSALWLIGVYFLQTVGELCLSPVGLSMVTKLSPVKFTSLLMGTWFLSSFAANLLAGSFAGHYDIMNHNLFFSVPMLTTGLSAVVLAFLIKPLKKWMHGVQ